MTTPNKNKPSIVLENATLRAEFLPTIGGKMASLVSSAIASDTEAEVTGAKFEKVNVRFTESAELKNALKKASFRDASTMGKK